MTKISRHERILVTRQIESTLNDYCRNDCPYLNSYDNKVCSTCPVGVQLQNLGHKLYKGDVVNAPKNTSFKWSAQDDERLIELLKIVSINEAARTLDKSYNSVWTRRKRLIKKGLIE